MADNPSQLYTPTFATPVNTDEMRYWVTNELREISRAVTQLAEGTGGAGQPFDADALITSSTNFFGYGIFRVIQGASAGELEVTFDNAAPNGINGQIVTATAHTGNNTDGYSINVFNSTDRIVVVRTKLINTSPPTNTNVYPISIRRTLT